MAAKTADELSKLALNGTKDKATNPQINGTNGTNGNLSDQDSDDDKEDDAAAGNTASGAAKKKKKRKPKKKKTGAKVQSDPPRVPVAQLFPNHSYPVGEEVEYKNDNKYRTTSEETEAAGSGEYNKFDKPGVYTCAGCGTVLYEDTHKFSSGCGWPAFYDNKEGAVERHEDNAFGMKRIEITCANCGGHLGHVFEGEGFDTPTDQRHCVNSKSIKHQSA